MVIDFDGEISPPHVQAVCQTLIDSNDALRLTISNEGSLPKQTFAERIDCPLEFVDFTTEAEKGEAQGLINEWLEARTNKLFDLSSSPIDGALLKQADDKYTLFYNIHHIAADGVSIQIVFDQLSEFYELAVAGDLPTVVEKTQFEPYRTQEDTYRQSARYTKSKQYWAQTLETTEAATYLGRASHKTSVDRNRITCELDVPMTKALKSFVVEIAKSGQTTESAALTNLLLAIYAAYLYRIGSSNRVSIGIPLHNRRTKSLKTALGLFMQVVPIQVDIDPAESIVDLSQRIAALTLEAMRHGRFPLRNSPQQPVYDAIFNLHIISRSKFGPFPAQNRWIHSGSGTDSIALQVADFSSSGTFEFSFDLHKEIFDEPLGQLAVRQFLQFFQEILRDRDRPLSQLPLLSPEDQQSLLTRFNPSGIPNPAETTVVARIEARTRALPTSIAATDGKQSLTYAQLNAKANQLARYLQAQGVGPESRVGICCQRSLDLVVAFLGSLKAGAAYVPLDAAYPDDRLHSIIDDAAVSLILTQAPLLSRFNQQCADSQQNSSKRDLQLIGLDTGWEAISREQDDNLNLVIHPESLAYIIYTSGSSGLPKGVGIPHKALASFTETAISRYQFSEDDRILQFASASFDAAVEEIFPCLSVGATLYLRKDEMLASPIAFAQACADWQLTVLDLPTAYWQEMVRSLADSNLPLTPSLRLVIIGGERALAEGYDRWQILCERQTSNACPSLINTYGPTETTVVSTTYTCSESVESGINSDTESSIPIGAPLDNASVYILDRHLQPVPVGVPGELYIGGYGLARGYLNRPDLTAEAFVPNPFSSVPGDRLYRTGDLGRYRDDGAIVFLGRRDRQVKWCGFRIELADIETALSALSGVKEAAVMLRQDRPQLPRLVAYYTSTNADEGHKPNQLRSLLQAKLPQYMLPSHYVALESMPLTPSGKLDRSALPAPSSDRSQLDTAFVKPTTELERTIAEIWQQVLGVDRVGLHDNFFDLGGHSLLLVQVHSQLLQELEARNTPDDTGELSLVDLFQYPTVQRLADRIAQGGHRVEDLAARAEHRASKQKQALSQRKRPPVRRQTHG
ncbi:MAG: amino acid adenylation domain-containing protein [Cyanobacteria bacterium P01_E01_bin.34]